MQIKVAGNSKRNVNARSTLKGTGKKNRYDKFRGGFFMRGKKSFQHLY
jgi:hypothetical protein